MLIPREEYDRTRKPQAPKIVAKLFGWFFPFSVPNSIRPWLLRAAGANVGRNIYIGRLCLFDDNFLELVTIEDDAVISSGCMIYAHDYSKPGTMVGPVTIKKGAFLGFGCKILPGVTIGEKAVVGAGAVVTRDVAPGTTVAGIPARPLAKQ